MSLPGIKADNNRFSEFTAGRFNQLGVFYGGGAQDNALYAGFKQLFYCFQPADSSANLGGD